MCSIPNVHSIVTFVCVLDCLTATDGLRSVLQNSRRPDGIDPQAVRSLHPETETHRGIINIRENTHYNASPIVPLIRLQVNDRPHCAVERCQTHRNVTFMQGRSYTGALAQKVSKYS